MISGFPSPLMSAMTGDDDRFQSFGVVNVQFGVGSAACALDAGITQTAMTVATSRHRNRIKAPIPVEVVPRVIDWSRDEVKWCRASVALRSREMDQSDEQHVGCPA